MPVLFMWIKNNFLKFSAPVGMIDLMFLLFVNKDTLYKSYIFSVTVVSPQIQSVLGLCK